MKRVLVLCTGNSCRSQMLHGYLAQDRSLEVASAGVDPHGLNPGAVAAMAEVGIDISQHTSNHVDKYREQPFDLVVTVCDDARERCPVLPGAQRHLHRSFPDPARATGTADETRAAFRGARDQLAAFAAELRRDLTGERLASGSAPAGVADEPTDDAGEQRGRRAADGSDDGYQGIVVDSGSAS